MCPPEPPRTQVLSEVDDAGFLAFKEDVRASLRGATSVQEASQRFASALFEHFGASIVLARVYLTVPLDKLPVATRGFVERALVAGGWGGEARPATPVLTLLGTAGVEPAWNAVHLSKGHAGIPLLGSRFLDTVPMIARLLEELGADISALDTDRGRFTRRLIGGFLGVFFVPDAATATDGRGRAVIPAKDFVARHHVRTVFGMGGAYLDGSMVTAVVFTNETLSRERAERFGGLISLFKAQTGRLARAHAIFER